MLEKLRKRLNPRIVFSQLGNLREKFLAKYIHSKSSCVISLLIDTLKRG